MSFSRAFVSPFESSQQPQRAALSAERLARWFDLPLYRERWARSGFSWPSEGPGPGAPGFEAVWRRIPFLVKADIRHDFPRNILRSGQSLEALQQANLVELEYTSGTAGERAAVVFGQGWWNAQEDRALRLNAFVASTLDANPSARRAVITTPTCNGLVCPSKWVPRAQRTLGGALYVNQARIPFLLKEEEREQMAREIIEWAPVFLDLDPVHGVWLATYCERHGIRFPSLRFVIASYEFVSIVHRRILERVFGVPVFNLYGSTETGHLLMEDARGVMRPCAENAHLEQVDVGASGVGELVVTTLTNDYMPLVRYRIGDLVERQPWDGAERYTVHGRVGDVLDGPGGVQVTTLQVDACFAGVEGFLHYQLRQAERGEATLRYVPDGAGPSEQDVKQVAGRLDDLLGHPGGITAESVPLLPPTPSGKFRLTQSGKD